jgi:putative ABC transport system permease protein
VIPATVLLKPGSVVITADIAKKYFGNENAIGKTIVMNENKKPFTVTGVLENIPSQSSLQFDFLMPVADFPAVKQFSWSLGMAANDILCKTSQQCKNRCCQYT